MHTNQPVFGSRVQLSSRLGLDLRRRPPATGFCCPTHWHHSVGRRTTAATSPVKAADPIASYTGFSAYNVRTNFAASLLFGNVRTTVAATCSSFPRNIDIIPDQARSLEAVRLRPEPHSGLLSIEEEVPPSSSSFRLDVTLHRERLGCSRRVGERRPRRRIAVRIPCTDDPQYLR